MLGCDPGAVPKQYPVNDDQVDQQDRNVKGPHVGIAVLRAEVRPDLRHATDGLADAHDEPGHHAEPPEPAEIFAPFRRTALGQHRVDGDYDEADHPEVFAEEIEEIHARIIRAVRPRTEYA